MSEIVDIHSHFLPPRVLRLLEDSSPDVVVRHGDGGIAIEYRGRALHAGLPPEMTDEVRHLEAMDRDGVRTHVISLPPPMVFWADAARGLELSRTANAELREMALRYPGRIVPMATLPIQDPSTAVDELNGIHGDAFAAVLVGSNIAGTELDDPSLEDFFAAAAARDMALFVHPIDPVGEMRMRAYRLDATLGMLAESGLAASRLICSGLLDRYPHLRVCISHFGGLLLPAAERVTHLTETWPGPTSRAKHAFHTYLSRLWFDTCVHSPAMFAASLPMLDRSKLMFGTDASTAFIKRLVAECPVLDDSSRADIFFGNAQRFADGALRAAT